MSLTPNQQSFYLPDVVAKHEEHGMCVKSDLQHGESYEVEDKTPGFEAPYVNKILRDHAIFSVVDTNGHTWDMQRVRSVFEPP